MNNTFTIFDFNKLNSPSRNHLLEEYNQMKSDYEFLKKNSNHWILNLYPNRRTQIQNTIKQLDKIFIH